MHRHLAELLVLGLLLSSAAHAQEAAPAPAPARKSDTPGNAKSGKQNALDALRPSGPVTVKADRVEWVQDSTMKYTGKVSLDSDTLLLRGDTMDIKQAADGNFEATIVGKPGTLDHQAVPGGSGPTAQAVHAEASQLHYNSSSGTVDLSGDAHLQRGTDQVHGDTIGYEVPERRVRASGGDQGQVTIIFTPPVKDAEPNSAPGKAPGNPAGKKPETRP